MKKIVKLLVCPPTLGVRLAPCAPATRLAGLPRTTKFSGSWNLCCVLCDCWLSSSSFSSLIRRGRPAEYAVVGRQVHSLEQLAALREGVRQIRSSVGSCEELSRVSPRCSRIPTLLPMYQAARRLHVEDHLCWRAVGFGHRLLSRRS